VDFLKVDAGVHDFNIEVQSKTVNNHQNRQEKNISQK